jgi:hypothetical protein
MEKNYCNSKGFCTLSDADTQYCTHWSPGRNKYCKHEKKVGESEYRCQSPVARSEAGCEEVV